MSVSSGQRVGEQQEIRPLLSPSIDDFLSDSRVDGPTHRPVTSNTAVLNTSLDLVDLSDPGDGLVRRGSSSSSGGGGGGGGGGGRRKGSSSRSSPRRKRAPESDLIQVEVERLPPSPHTPRTPRTPERISLDSVSLSSPLERWEDLTMDLEASVSRRGRRENKCSSNHSSSELLWSAEFKTDPSTRNTFDVRSLDEGDLLSTSPQDCARQRRRARSLLARKLSLEDEFVKAKAAVESDTEFWDKMQAEWEELARRNWLDESENESPLAPSISPVEKPPSSDQLITARRRTAFLSQPHMLALSRCSPTQPGWGLVTVALMSVNAGWGLVTVALMSLNAGWGRVTVALMSVNAGWGLVTVALMSLNARVGPVTVALMSLNAGWGLVTVALMSLNAGWGLLLWPSCLLMQGGACYCGPHGASIERSEP
ncbi:unnamed protein product [Boreogadus saida]